MIYTLIALQVLDIISTYLCLKNEKGTEANTWIAKLMEKVGVLQALILTKAVFIAMLLIWGHLVHEYAMVFLIFFYVYICINNFAILRKK
jgi:hypothetical protein